MEKGPSRLKIAPVGPLVIIVLVSESFVIFSTLFFYKELHVWQPLPQHKSPRPRWAILLGLPLFLHRGVFWEGQKFSPPVPGPAERFVNEARDSLATNRANESGGSGDRDPEQLSKQLVKVGVRVPQPCANDTGRG